MDTKDLIIQKMQELIDHYWHYHDCSRCHEIKMEIAKIQLKDGAESSQSTEKMDTKDEIIKKQDELLKEENDLIMLFENGIRLVEVPNSIYNKIAKLKSELAALRSRLEPDKPKNIKPEDCAVECMGPDCEGCRKYIPVEPDMKVDGISEAAKWREPDKKSA